MSGFCHFGLVLFMVLWQSPDTPVMSCFYASARLRVCSSRALLLVSCWSVVFGSRHSCLEFRFVSGFGDSRSMFCLVLGACSLVFCYVARSLCFIGCVLSCCHVLCEHVAYEYTTNSEFDIVSRNVIVFLPQRWPDCGVKSFMSPHIVYVLTHWRHQIEIGARDRPNVVSNDRDIKCDYRPTLIDRGIPTIIDYCFYQ